MAKYFLAPALVTLRDEINKAHPKRDKKSDGWIGDASHQAAKSDHNPDYADGGVVRATDTDKDGVDIVRLVEIARHDPRVNYVIYAGFIYSRKYGFRKRKYTGSNGHYGHAHVSLNHGKQYENNTKPWGYAQVQHASAIPNIKAPGAGNASIGIGGRPNVNWLQRHLNCPVIDNKWGPDTDKRFLAVRDATVYHARGFPFGKKFAQMAVGTKDDGDWGPKSEAALKATVKDLQITMNNMGLNSGVENGVWGAQTERAWKLARQRCKL